MSEADEIQELLNKRIEALGRKDAVPANELLDRDSVAFELEDRPRPYLASALAVRRRRTDRRLIDRFPGWNGRGGRAR